MKISVTKFTGGTINEIGNYCIAGHNNLDGTMFGKVKKLKIGDTIKLTNLYGETLEYQICKANVYAGIERTKGTWLYELVQQVNADGLAKVESYIAGLGNREMNDEEQQNVALLIWKCLPSKAEFAQTLNSYLLEKVDENSDIKFAIPPYIQDAIAHLVR